LGEREGEIECPSHERYGDENFPQANAELR
jgi:hypothetical protein